MNQTEFQDRCSKCGQLCTRVRFTKYIIGQSGGILRFVTSCCLAPPLAVPVVKET